MTTPMPNVFAEYWIQYDEHHQPIACAGANTVISDISVGYIGLFEAKNEHAGTIVLKAATEWLQCGGLQQFEPVRQILGPVNLTTWLQYRLRVDTDEQPSMSFEPHHPAFYQECFAQAGFIKAMDYYTTFFRIDPMIEGYKRYTRGVTPSHLYFDMQYWNTLDFAASLTPERHPELTAQDNTAKRIYDLSVELFRGKELFDESLSRKDHRQIVLNDMISRPQVDNASMLDLSSFIVDLTTGEDAGYIAAWVENHDTLVLKTIGFTPKVRKTKIFAVSLLETLMRAKDHWGCVKVACALMNENSTAISEKLGGKSVRHVYRLYIHQPRIENVRQGKEHNCANRGLDSPSNPSKSTTTTNNRTMVVTKTPANSAQQTPCHLQKRPQDITPNSHWDRQRMTPLAYSIRVQPLARL
ncbi:hypothetical protein BGX28_009148 [Mortierella sp. GBA30]|nr:hypothetical protein BGX28_009148 [Mortierella sp. GBA30]